MGFLLGTVGLDDAFRHRARSPLPASGESLRRQHGHCGAPAHLYAVSRSTIRAADGWAPCRWFVPTDPRTGCVVSGSRYDHGLDGPDGDREGLAAMGGGSHRPRHPARDWRYLAVTPPPYFLATSEPPNPVIATASRNVRPNRAVRAVNIPGGRHGPRPGPSPADPDRSPTPADPCRRGESGSPSPPPIHRGQDRHSRRREPLGYRRHSTNVAADQLTWLVYQSGVSPESAGWESLSGADRSMSSLVAAQLASRFRASCEGDAGSAV